MSTKKILRLASFVVLFAISIPVNSAFATEYPANNDKEKTENARAQVLTHRLEDIKGMNKSELTRLEKKELRMEVKSIKKEMKELSGGVYLSVGAIIIVILLLILLL